MFMTAHEPYLLSSEDPAEFEQLHRSLEQAHQPENAHECILVEEFAQAYWELKRVRRIGRDFWFYVGEHYNSGTSGIAEAIVQQKDARFRTHFRLRAQAERAYYRALDALERMHRNRDRRPARAIPEAALTAAAAHSVTSPVGATLPESAAAETAAEPARQAALHLVPPTPKPQRTDPGNAAAGCDSPTCPQGYRRRCGHVAADDGTADSDDSNVLQRLCGNLLGGARERLGERLMEQYTTPATRERALVTQDCFDDRKRALFGDC